MTMLSPRTLLGLSIAFFAVACSTDDADVNEDLPTQDGDEVIGEDAGDTVWQDDLVFMREEEKLARDVYLALYEVWGVQAHLNVSDSEQQHTDAVADLLERYDLEDPVVDDTVGVFTNSDLDTLYDELVDWGSESKVEALMVGATIEDLDMVDLQDAMERTQDPEIIAVYENLHCGSRNHLRSFVSLLEKEGVEYEATTMDPVQMEQILDTEHESCG